MCNGRGTVSNGGTFKLVDQWSNRLLMEREIRDKIDTGITVTMGLTTKQELFSKLVALDGLSASEAYRQIYDSNPSNQSSIHEQASKLMSNSKVSTRIEAMKADISEKLASEVVWNKAKIVSELSINVDLGRETKQLAASNQAINLIGKAINVFGPDIVAVSGTVSVIHSLSDAQLDQLASMVQEPAAIDDSEAIEAESYQLLEPEP